MDPFDEYRQFDRALQLIRSENRFFYFRSIAPAAAPVTCRDSRELAAA